MHQIKKETELTFKMNVERYYETFSELKWYRAKKQLPIIYMENILLIPRPKK